MISAKLIKSLEKKGFSLEFPYYGSLEDEIIEILKEENPRLNASFVVLLNGEFDYKMVSKKLSKAQKKQFDKSIAICNKIYNKEKISNKLSKIIKSNKIKIKFSESELMEYYSVFKESLLSFGQKEQKNIENQSKLRLKLNMNKDLQVLFSPAKIRIIEKIFNHKALTNTELKYYYKAISNINKAVLNSALQDYLKIIELTKKKKC